MLNIIDKGRRTVSKCLMCNHCQLGWSGIDGAVCEKCEGYLAIQRYALTKEVQMNRVLGNMHNE